MTPAAKGHQREFAKIDQVIRKNARVFRKPGLLTVRPGFKIKNGWLTDKHAIVVHVLQKGAVPDAVKIPPVVDGYPTDVRQANSKHIAKRADPKGFANNQQKGETEETLPTHPYLRDAQTGEPVPQPKPSRSKKTQVAYTAPRGASLKAVQGKMSLTCHVSPDAGWNELKGFLGGVRERLTVGMYDFTSAHVLQTLQSALHGSQKLSLVLDHPINNPSGNQTDEATRDALAKQLGERLQFAWAAEDRDPMVSSYLFPNAYHIKVAVKDGTSFWLSSGNWNNSNQPDVDLTPGKQADAAVQAVLKNSDRDWHVIVQHEGLAKTFEAYLLNDLKTAAKVQDGSPEEDDKYFDHPDPKGKAKSPVQFFGPKQFENVNVKVQPVLTPDKGAGNYASNFLNLIESAKEKLYIQTQYCHPGKPGDAQAAGFEALLDAVAKKIEAKVDVRLIFSQYMDEDWLERIQAVGIPGSVVKVQQNVHNKGFVVDGKTVALGSQNWSCDGALNNRDASLIIFDAQVAQYYEAVFLHDWEHMGVQQVPKYPVPRVAAAGKAKAAAAGSGR